MFNQSLIDQVLDPEAVTTNIGVPLSIVAAFIELQQLGYFAKANFWCCQSCALYAIPDEQEKYVYYHEQDAKSMIERGGELLLAWGGNGDEICAVLNKHGLKTEWNGSEDMRIKVYI